MIYKVRAKSKIKVGGWPQNFLTVFHVSAKDLKTARLKADEEMSKMPVEFSNIDVVEIGREYEVSGHLAFKFCGIPYTTGTITKISVFPDNMTIGIDYEDDAHEETSSDSIGVWVRPQDFKEAVKELLSKVNYKEI